ncbi:uncharacterized protein [Rutidosis leptorrhynchoides]|uniref:uncharacterized protein n=1 Tax=Rutidosis leptorrhynchoides TaxID=125765 RepID=UPI003A990861
MADPKEGGVVKKGHEQGLKLAISILEEYRLPLGLLPLEDVMEKRKIEHTYKLIKKPVSFDTEITGYVEKKRIKKLKGVKAKELMLWPPVNDITVDDPPTGKIHFKSLAGITKTFPEEAFAAGQLESPTRFVSRLISTTCFASFNSLFPCMYQSVIGG